MAHSRETSSDVRLTVGIVGLLLVDPQHPDHQNGGEAQSKWSLWSDDVPAEARETLLAYTTMAVSLHTVPCLDDAHTCIVPAREIQLARGAAEVSCNPADKVMTVVCRGLLQNEAAHANTADSPHET